MAQRADISPAPAGLLQRACACGNHAHGGECESCKRKREQLQRAGVGEAPAAIPGVVHEVLRSPGSPLDTAARAELEPRFGYDFSHVRVHTGPQAADSARQVNARAYTVGQQVVFGAGQYAPHTPGGQRRLAPEWAPTCSTRPLIHSPDPHD
nr:MAG: hypothetical protein DIU80_12660 [Chloroflexota bacterium]